MVLKDLTDFQLVSQVVIFNRREAFDVLVQRHQASIRRFFLHHSSGNQSLSDDLAQEVFVRAWIHIASFKALSKFSTWLFKIAFNIWYDYLKSIAPTTDISPKEFRIVGETPTQDVNIDIYRALDVLRPEEKTAILLSFIEGYSHPQVAKIMGCPIGTVKTHILRGKAKLHAYLDDNIINNLEVS